MSKEKVLALDIGEKSIGWAINEYDNIENNAEIVDFGVRIFDNSSYTKSSERSKLSYRREKRGQRRLIARRRKRLLDLKNLFIEEKLVNFEGLEEILKNKEDVFLPFKVRERGLNKKISGIELLIALNHIIKRRGYNDKFETNQEKKDNDEKIDMKEREKSLWHADFLIEKYKYPILTYWHQEKPREKIEISGIPENLFIQDSNKSNSTGFIYKANKPTKNNNQRFNNNNPILFKREHYKKEVEKILENQNLDTELNEKILDIIFRQRDFEDGAGPGRIDSVERENWKKTMRSKHLKQGIYGSFYDKTGKCSFFINEDRMTIFSLESDLNFILNQSSKVFANIQIEFKTRENIKKLTRKILENFLRDFKFNKEEMEKVFKEENIPFPSFVQKNKKDKNDDEYDDEKIVNFNYKFFLTQLFEPYDTKKKNVKLIIAKKDEQLTDIEKEQNKEIEKQNKEIKKTNELNIKLNKEIEKLILSEVKKINFDELPRKNFDDNLINELGEIYSKFKTPSRLREEINKLNIDILTKREKFDLPTGKRKKTSKLFTLNALKKQLNEGVLISEYMAELERKNQNEYLEKGNESIKIRQFFDKDMVKNVSVFRSINQTIKLINKLIKEHGYFKTIVVETAKDLYSTKKDINDAISKAIRIAEERERIITILKRENIDITWPNIEKVRLFKSYYFSREDFFKVPISKLEIKDYYDINLIDKISLEEFLKNDYYEIDHILPREKTRNNSFLNKIITSKIRNGAKKGRTPIQYFKSFSNDMEINSWVLKISDSFKKERLKYLTWGLDNSDFREYETYDLNNTRYITKYITNYLNLELKRIPTKVNISEVNIFPIPGQLTSIFRKIWLKETPWGIKDKERNITPFHHTVDAFVLSNMVSKQHIEFYRTINKLIEIYNEYIYDFSKSKNYFLATIERSVEKFKRDVKTSFIKRNEVLTNKFIYILEEYGKYLKQRTNAITYRNELKYFSFDEEGFKNLNLNFSVINELDKKVEKLIPIKLKKEWENVYFKFSLKSENIINIVNEENGIIEKIKINGNVIDVIKKRVKYKQNKNEFEKIFLQEIGKEFTFYEQKFIKYVNEKDQIIMKPIKREFSIFEKLIEKSEYEKENNRKYPYVSYKEDKRTRGKIISNENPMEKKEFLKLKKKYENESIDNIIKKEELIKDKHGNIWKTNKFVGITVLEEKNKNGKIIKKMNLVTYNESQKAYKNENKIKIFIGKNTIFKAKYNGKYVTEDGLFKFISVYDSGAETIYALHPNLNDVKRDETKERFKLDRKPIYSLKKFEFEKIIQF